MKKILIINLLIGIVLLLAADPSIALVTKSTGDVSYQKYSETNPVGELPKGTELYNDDLIRTGSDGYAKYVFLDDGSTVKVTQNAEIYVNGTIKGSAIEKRVNVAGGSIKFEVSSQKSSEFTIVTPTSVASVKGTRFWLECLAKKGDRFHGFDGTVKVRNSTSQNEVTLLSGTTVTSLPDGKIDVKPTEPGDLKDLPIITGETDETGDGGEPEPGETQELRIRMVNSQGEEKELFIQYK